MIPPSATFLPPLDEPAKGRRRSGPTGLQAALGFAGIMLVALNLRDAVPSVTPLYGYIRHSFPVSATALSLLGALPLICFAAFGQLAPRLTRRFGLEATALIAMVMLAGGEIGRAFSPSILAFGLISLFVLGGMGVANVIVPPLIRKRFPNQVGVLTSLYLVLIVVSASVPPLVAAPLADALGWRASIGCWAVLAIAAVLPWLVMLKREDSAPQTAMAAASPNVWAWPTSWAVLIVFAVGALNMYAYVSWLPTVLVSSAHVSAGMAGLMLAIFNVVGIPHSFVIPSVLSKSRRPEVLIYLSALFTCSGALGFAFLPMLAWIWIFPAGLGAMFLTTGIALINQRTRTPAGGTALSGLVQGPGYLLAAIGPWLFGVLHQASGGWTGSFLFLAATGLIGLVAGLFAVRRITLEDVTPPKPLPTRQR